MTPDNRSRQQYESFLRVPMTISDRSLLIGSEVIGIPSLTLGLLGRAEALPSFTPDIITNFFAHPEVQVAAISLGILSEIVAGLTIRNMYKNHQRLLPPGRRKSRGY